MQNEDGCTFMIATDLMRAIIPNITPLSSHLVRESYLSEESFQGDLKCFPLKFFMLFDTNGDRLISFLE